MSFSALKLGGWAFGEILASAQMNYLNGAFPQAVDGTGGTYANSSEIRFTGNFRCDGITTLDSCTMSGALTAPAITTTALTCSGAAAMGSLEVDGNTTLGFSPTDTTHVIGPATLDDNLNVNGNTTLGNSSADTTTINGPSTFQVVPLFSDGLSWKQTTGVDSGAGPSQIYSAKFNFIRWPGLITADITANIDTDGSGNRFMFVCLDNPSAHTLTVDFPGGSTVTLAGGSGSQCALFIHNGTQWFGPVFKV